ncbi:ribonuclease Z [Alkalibacillus aidingensis]|uniref:ribonuclease Z n=1 Tax=Alkalibacillus aidingensis TaxID=2747607 RepID=UPI0016617E12|nr:ribonuclease Z [Alkalibacillus aidingensis]
MELTFLGTGSGVPSKIRNVSSMALQMLQERDEVWLFDCGEATQHQIMHTTIKPRKITKIFITHLHGDHIFGLPGLLSSRSFQDGTTPVHIYGPQGIKAFVETSFSVSSTQLKYPIYYHELTEGLVFDDEQISVDAKKLAHGVPSYGFLIREKDQIGRLIPEKLKKKGVKPGPIYQDIKANERMTLSDGTVIIRDEVTGPPIPGRKVAIMGDTLPKSDLADFVKEVDVLIHEATFTHQDKELAQQYNHSTSEDAAKIAKQAQVEQLLLTHISSRYHSKDLEQELKHIKTIFNETLFAFDFDNYTIDRKEDHHESV